MVVIVPLTSFSSLLSSILTGSEPWSNVMNSSSAALGFTDLRPLLPPPSRTDDDFVNDGLCGEEFLRELPNSLRPLLTSNAYPLSSIVSPKSKTLISNFRKKEKIKISNSTSEIQVDNHHSR